MIGALLLALLPAATTTCDTAVVCPQEFQQALRPWIEHRAAQGHSFALISNLQSPEAIRRQIRQSAPAGNLRYILLVGDADPAAETNAALRARCVPTHYAAAKVNVEWGSEREIASDNWYADLDDDRVPDVAIGRLTADSAAELSVIVAKIIAYERSADFGHWRRRVNFVAGLGGFGALADGALEAVAKKLITDGIPPDYDSSMTYGSWRSPYCPDPRSFQQITISRLNEGCLFWVYLGHGQRRLVDFVHVPGANYPILSDGDVKNLRCRSGAIACFLSCYTAAFDDRQDCLAEEMLRTPGAPVAIVGGTRVTMPYAMSVMGMELLDACFVRHAETLGEAMLTAKQNMVRPKRVTPNRLAVDALAAVLSPSNLLAERAEHLDLFNLIGDPMLRLRFPRQIKLDVAEQAIAGGRLHVDGASEVDGPCTVELVVRRDRLTFAPPPRPQYTLASTPGFDEIYRRANDSRLAAVEVRCAGGRFATDFTVPRQAHGPCHVRAYVEGAADFASGAANVEISEDPAAN